MRRHGCAGFLMVSVFAAAVALGAAAGCTPTARSTPRKAVLPGPSTVNMTGTIAIELPPELAAQQKLPATLSGQLSITGNAHAIEASPLRSRYEGTVNVIITDEAGGPARLSFSVTLGGERNGSPNEAVAEMFRRFWDEYRLLGVSVSAAAEPDADR